VKAECQAAHDYGKPILAFCRVVPSRDAEAVDLLRSLDVKYDNFVNAIELRERIRKSLGLEILRLIRSEGQMIGGHGDKIARLRRFAKERTVVRVSPLIPPCQYDEFRVAETTSELVTLIKAVIA
jgi:hypothetical protein